jgi:hypothetical protein
MANQDFKPIIKDQYLAGQVYFACVVGLICLEAISVLPAYLLKLFKSGKSRQNLLFLVSTNTE